MSTDTSTFRPVPTCDIPLPILEGASQAAAGQAEIPRILLQAAGTQAAARRVVLITAVFLLIAAMDGLLLCRLPNPEPLVVYHDVPRHNLVEPVK